MVIDDRLPITSEAAGLGLNQRVLETQTIMLQDRVDTSSELAGLALAQRLLERHPDQVQAHAALQSLALEQKLLETRPYTERPHTDAEAEAARLSLSLARQLIETLPIAAQETEQALAALSSRQRRLETVARAPAKALWAAARNSCEISARARCVVLCMSRPLAFRLDHANDQACS